MHVGRLLAGIGIVAISNVSGACNRSKAPADKRTGRHPNAIAKSAPTATGCWVQIWEDENFQDDNDVIVGPGKWNNMRNLPGANKTDWGDEIDSLKTGPDVQKLTVWEDEDYKDNS